MVFRRKEENVDVRHESTKTVITINGKRVELDDSQGGLDALSILKSQGIDIDQFPESMLSEISGMLSTGTINKNSHSNVKVDCTSCTRKVAYGRGSCMYCGAPLTLPESADNKRVTNDVDAKFLNTTNIDSDNSVVESDLSYIDRLKDL